MSVITKQIYDQMGQQFHGMDTHSIGVDEFQPGVITLSGTTMSTSLPEELEKLARNVPGVTKVDNNIQVNQGS